MLGNLICAPLISELIFHCVAFNNFGRDSNEKQTNQKFHFLKNRIKIKQCILHLLQKTPAPGFLTKPSRGRCDAQNEVIGAKIKFIALQSAGILHQKFGLCTRFRAGPPNVAPGRWSWCATISVSCVIPDLRAPAKCLTPIVTDKEPAELPSSSPAPRCSANMGEGSTPLSSYLSPTSNLSLAPFGLLHFLIFTTTTLRLNHRENNRNHCHRRNIMNH